MATVRRTIKQPVGDPTAPMNDKFEEMRKEDSRLIKGIFQDNEVKGGNRHFFFRKWKGDKVQEYKLYDGQEYELPLAVVKHLNSGCAVEQHSYLLGPDGKHLKTGRKEHRFSFKTHEYL